MDTNALPRYDDSDNPTGCCPKFNPDGWDGRELHFENKDFIRATTVSAMHVPLNMGKVFTRVQEHIEENGAYDPENCIVLSRELSPWQAEHLFSISNPVPEEEPHSYTLPRTGSKPPNLLCQQRASFCELFHLFPGNTPPPIE